MNSTRKQFGNLPIGRTRHIGDISEVAWEVRDRDDKTSITFKSHLQIEHRNCAFEIDGVTRDGWSIRVTSYNDFGREYKHLAEKLGAEPNP